MAMLEREATVKRNTQETNVNLTVKIDGSGEAEMNTGIRMLDHLLAQIARHGIFNLKISANGDNVHHVVEDVALCLGRAFNEALGDKRGIVRMADVTVPMDESLATVVVDIGGRGYTVLELPFAENDLAEMSSDLVRHFLESFAAEAKLNLHARIICGVNDHHKAEALFKALGRALDAATTIDPRIVGELPSTKGSI
jgi:imidazoleglycerol-phosphate dehydratase